MVRVRGSRLCDASSSDRTLAPRVEWGCAPRDERVVDDGVVGPAEEEGSRDAGHPKDQRHL
eukprot:scaffold80857_cov36-Phaeocystis_antarctica.AAC.2